MAERVRVALDDLPDEIRRRIVDMEGSDSEARAWMERPNPGMGGYAPAESLATPVGLSQFWNRTSNHWVRGHLDTFLKDRELHQQYSFQGSAPGCEGSLA